MISKLFDASQLDGLLSQDDEVRTNAEAYFQGLSNEGNSAVICEYDDEGAYWQKITAGIIGFLIAEVLTLSYLACIADILRVDVAIMILVGSAVVIPASVLVNWKNLGRRQKTLTRALVLLNGGEAIDKIITLWSSASQPLADDYVRLAAVGNIARQIIDLNGIIPAISDRNRHVLCNYAVWYLRKSNPAEQEIVFREAIVRCSENLFSGRDYERIQVAVGKMKENSQS